jgi:hypothetical protein
MIAAPLVAIGAVLASATVLSGGMVFGWGLRGLTDSRRCACGHGWGTADRYDGHCTATVIQTNYVGGVRRTRKRVPCPCKAHRPAGMSAPDATDRQFVEAPR